MASDSGREPAAAFAADGRNDIRHFELSGVSNAAR